MMMQNHGEPGIYIPLRMQTFRNLPTSLWGMGGREALKQELSAVFCPQKRHRIGYEMFA